MSVKMRSKAWSIESVRTNVPLIIATPRTIAMAVSAVRSFRLRRPRIAKRPTPRGLLVGDRFERVSFAARRAGMIAARIPMTIATIVSTMS